MAYWHANRDRYRETRAAYYQAKKPEYKRRAREWYLENTELVAANSRSWREKNRERVAGYSHKRREIERRATPTWANMPLIEKAYEDAKLISEKSGVPHCVDHIVPLQSDLVCGLHCEQNLQIITISANASKSNVSWPDMP
jgi:hypothetical protein